MLFSGCGYSNVASESFESMDTFMKIDIYGSADTAAEIRAEIENLDSLLSAQDDSSEIGRLNKIGSAELSEDTADLRTQTARWISRSIRSSRRGASSTKTTAYPAKAR